MTGKIKLIITLLLLILLSVFSLEAAASYLVIHYIDVGQADAILIKLPNGENMLIDAGNNADGENVVNYIKNQGVHRIDYLIGTHPHEDHIGGLDNVLHSFPIGEIYMPRVAHNSKTFINVLRALKEKNMKITPAHKGVVLFRQGNLEAVILSPISDSYEELNNWSVVVKLTYGSTSFLFTGDAEELVEEQLLNSGVNLKSQILKVGHHGSNSSNSPSFLKEVAPQYAVISVGRDNSYGHPAPETLKSLNEGNIQVYRTDLQGTIVAFSNGQTIKFNQIPLSAQSEDTVEKQGIIISDVDLDGEIVTIKNTSDQTIDLSGWKLVSVNGNQTFIFPEGTILKPEELIKITSGSYAEPGTDTLVWTKQYRWNTNGDPAELYDSNDKLISIFY